MKAKMDEIWAIYIRNLSQNSRWDINLPLKINFGRWIKNLEQSGHWIAILLLKSHLSRRINTDVIWTVKSRCVKEGEYRQFFGDLSAIYCLQKRFFHKIADISPIFWPFLRKYLSFDFSPRNIVLTLPDTLSSIYPETFLLAYTLTPFVCTLI